MVCIHSFIYELGVAGASIWTAQLLHSPATPRVADQQRCVDCWLQPSDAAWSSAPGISSYATTDQSTNASPRIAGASTDADKLATEYPVKLILPQSQG